MKKTISRVLLSCLILAMLIGTAFAEPSTYSKLQIDGAQGTLLLGDTMSLTASVVQETCTEHKLGEAEVVTPATCTTKGQKKQICERCGAEVLSDIDVDPNAHQVSEWTPDETNTKWTGTCSLCGETVESQTDPTTPPAGEASANAMPMTTTAPAARDAQTVEAAWSVKSGDAVTVTPDGGMVQAVKPGKAVIQATYDGLTAEVSVTVPEPSVSCKNTSVSLGSSVSLHPQMNNVASGVDVVWTYSNPSGPISVSSDGKSIYADSRENGIASVKVTGTFSHNGVTYSKDATVKIGVYKDKNITAVMKPSVNTFTLGDSCADKFSSVTIDRDSFNYAEISSNTLVGLLEAKSNDLSLDTTGNAAGTFDAKYSTVPSTLKFTASGVPGTVEYYYEVYAAEDAIILQGTLTIDVSGGQGDITYSTDSKTKVTFDEDDFVKFWNKQDVKGDLKYVMFDVENYPQYGNLYTTPSTDKYVRTDYEFKPYYSNETGYYDLDQVTYDPETYASGVQTVSIPFTCVGTTSGEKANGVVIIQLNNKGTSITSRGVKFGSNDYDITGLMEDIYKTATGNNLSYVTFPSVDPEDGKLFSSFTTMLDSSQVASTYKFYVDPTGAQLDLDDVVFVPRAGLKGSVTLYFTGYAGNGSKANCSITFNVTQKSKSSVFSDVTSSSYSWAADAVDFLYYEGVANGSNGKYNPASNITRGDFMLMLYRAFLEDEYEDYNVTSNFPDVVKGSDSYSKETYQAVGVAKHLGIAQGTNGKYNPKAYITREEAMTLIYRTLDEVGYSMSYTVSTDTDDFKDYSSVSSYAKTAISDLIEHGVVVGTNGKINPKSNITRAEMAVILHRVLTY